MRFQIRTEVKGHYSFVMSKFDKSLFKKLAPPGTPVRIIRFDGSHKGATVHIEMKLAGLIRQEWISKITDQGEDDRQTFFIDEGTRLPFFLSQWRHRHIVENLTADKSVIVDDIEYRTPTLITDYLLYPFMYLQFWYRKPVYRKFFSRLSN